MIFNVSKAIQIRPWITLIVLFTCALLLHCYFCPSWHIPTYFSQNLILRFTKTSYQPGKDLSWTQVNASGSSSSMNTVNILCFGDSITEGFVSGSPDFYSHPYTITLTELLNNKASGQNVKFAVYNRGLAGEYVQGQMLHRLRSLLELSTAQFNVIVILGGTNDIKRAMWYDNHDDDLVYKGLVQLHEFCHTKGIRTVAVTIPARLCERQEANQCAKAKTMRLAINRKLREFSTGENKKKVILADLAEKLPLHALRKDEIQKYWADEVHFTDDGYNRMGEIIFEVLVHEVEGKRP